MNNSPWPMVALGEILNRSDETVEIKPQLTYKQVTVRLWGQGVVLRNEVEGTQIGGNRRYVVRPGQFILSRIDARNGALGLVPTSLDGAVVSNDFPTFDVEHHRLEPRFLEWLSKTGAFVDMCRAASEGTTNRVRLKVERFMASEISLPPLEEQRRIVARIEALAAKVQATQELRGKTIEETEALTHSQARKTLSAIDAKTTELRNWLDPIRAGIQTGPFGAQLSSEEFSDSGIPVLTIGNIQFDGLKTDSLKHVSPEKAKQLERFALEQGDILFARMGTVGRCCVVPEKANGWLINYHIIRVALDKSQVEPRFIHWTIQASPDVEAYLSDNIRGATRQGVNSKIVGGLPCRIPSLSEQRRIVAELDGLQARLAAVQEHQTVTQAALDALLPSILDQAFRGEL